MPIDAFSQGMMDATTKELAEELAEAGEFGEGRPSKYKTAAAKGLKEYWFTEEMEKNLVGKKEERGLKSSAELTPDEAAEIRDSISLANVSSVVKRAAKRTAPKPADSPRTVATKKRRKELGTSRSTSQRKLKALIDKTTNEKQDLQTKVESLTSKGYPLEMVNFLMGKVSGC